MVVRAWNSTGEECGGQLKKRSVASRPAQVEGHGDPELLRELLDQGTREVCDVAVRRELLAAANADLAPSRP